MNILITSAASDLAQKLAATLSEAHQIRLTELVALDETDAEFVQSDLGHDEATNQLVQGMDAVIHVAQLPPAVLEASDQPENTEIDFQTRCTYNLLMAASEEKVPHAIYASTLHLFDQHDENWTVTEGWRPRPTTDAPTLSKHLGEFTCREFARERRINITCLRLGTLTTVAETEGQQVDSTWLEMDDAVHAFECALQNPAGRWAIFHIQSEFLNSRFSIDRAKSSLKFNPQFTIGQT